GSVEGVQIYGPVTAQAFQTPLPRPIAGVGAWRHGLAEYDLPGGFTGVGHSGGTLSFFSNMVLTPKLGLGVFVAVNTESGGGLTDALPKRVVERFYAPPAPPAPPGSLALMRDRSAFEGHYLTTRRAYHGLEGFVFRLVRGQSIKVSPEGRLIVAGPGFVARLSPVGSPTAGRFIDDDGVTPVVFEMRDGVARRYYTGGGAAERQNVLRQPVALILLTVMTAVAAIATLGGLISRLRRDYRESTAQRRAGLMEAGQAALWIAAIALFGAWAMNTGDLASVMYDWPGIPLMLASACALVASAMAVGSIVFLPFVWRGGRRVDSWTTGRKMRFTLTALIFFAYAVFLGTWGALEPWSG
ncbi:MAG TPA: serine hydrolase, partial [Caulobacteraceae bacterium]|nr:serine hydrolase [Caulobacteraceae bacterium]